MDFSKLNSIIEQYRPLTGMSSLPFIIEINNTLQIRWFNYYLEQKDTDLTIFIQSIFTADELMQVKEIKCNLQLHVILEDIDEPKLGEGKYLLLLNDILSDYNKEKMNDLIAQAEMKPLLTAYRAVANHK